MSKRSPHQQQGFSLIELSVVVAVLGVMTFAVSAGFENVQGYRQHRQATADADSAHAAIRAFTLRNRRLPCPDSSLSGHLQREPSGGCIQASGWLPYETLGLSPPRQSARMRYGIYLQGAINLANPAPRASDGLDLDGVGGLLTSLAAAATRPPNTDSAYYQLSSSPGSPPRCNGGALTNPAFVVVAPAGDLSGDGELFESVNRNFGNGDHCTSAPSRRADSTLDDVVVAESTNALLGWLTASLR